MVFLLFKELVLFCANRGFRLASMQYTKYTIVVNIICQEIGDAILKGWEIENRCKELAQERGVEPFGPLYEHFSKQLDRDLENEMKHLVGLPGSLKIDEQGIGRYAFPGWNEARLDRPQIKAMFDAWQEVVNRAGGSKLAEINPLEVEKK